MSRDKDSHHDTPILHTQGCQNTHKGRSDLRCVISEAFTGALNLCVIATPIAFNQNVPNVTHVRMSDMSYISKDCVNRNWRGKESTVSSLESSKGLQAHEQNFAHGCASHAQHPKPRHPNPHLLKTSRAFVKVCGVFKSPL